MKKFKEATPLEDRDEIAAFQAQRDKEEATPAAEKYADELKKRNGKYAIEWQNFFSRLREVIEGFSYYSEGFDDACDGEDPYLPATGYFDSASFYGPEGAGDSPNVEGIGIYIYHLKDNGGGTEAGGVSLDEFISRVKKDGGVEFMLGGFWGVDEDDDDYQRIVNGYDTEFNQVVNAHVKCLLNKGHSRKDVAKEVQFFKNVDKKDFPGCYQLDVQGDNCGRVMPTILAWYKLSPLPTKEEQDNVIQGVKTLMENMCCFGDI